MPDVRRRIRTLLVIVGMVIAPFIAGAATQPASACMGDPCDGICNFQNSHPSKLWPNGCQIR
jgi:hypothetical protein